MTVINLPKVKIQSIFCTPSQKFKILCIPNCISHGKSFKHGFTKKHDSHKLCAKSKFDRFFMHCLRNLKYYPYQRIAHGKSYKHGFTKKCGAHRLYVMSRFVRVFVHHLKNSKYYPFPMY
ncbi:hypothetical protein BHM03_00019285 [Ensete ventricosum]|nr:hypothetical protein BHM03_00019285 [Ensete ventricosum]